MEELLRQEKLSVGAIEHVEESVAVRMKQQLALAALPWSVDHNRGLGGVPVPEIVRSELVIPLELSGLAIEREDRVGIQIVALP